MTSSQLQNRISALSTSHRQVIPLLERLEKWSDTPGQGDDARIELGAEIHLRLKEMEDEMELLRVELDELEAGGGRKRQNEEREAEREQFTFAIRKVENDMKMARTRFRKAQIQAKRNAQIAKQKERQLLFSNIDENGKPRKKVAMKFTHDDLVVNASNDVTAALKRTHQLMQSELSRSQFAQQTLEQSTAALTSLSESYSNLDSLLASSRSLVSSLLRSQKSDTWYLETAFYILIGTIIWLVFRRILYGPLWWLLWIPLKLFFRSVFAISGLVGLSGGAKNSVVEIRPVADINLPSISATMTVPSMDSIAGTETMENDATMRTSGAENDHLTDQVADMVDQRAKEEEEHRKESGTNVDDVSPEERKRQEEMPRNPKKRMWEEDIGDTITKDEL